VEDPADVRQLRRQAARIYRESAAVAVLVTGLAMLARSVVGP
jgi:hypothetical protein